MERLIHLSYTHDIERSTSSGFEEVGAGGEEAVEETDLNRGISRVPSPSSQERSSYQCHLIFKLLLSASLSCDHKLSGRPAAQSLLGAPCPVIAPLPCLTCPPLSCHIKGPGMLPIKQGSVTEGQAVLIDAPFLPHPPMSSVFQT